MQKNYIDESTQKIMFVIKKSLQNFQVASLAYSKKGLFSSKKHHKL